MAKKGQDVINATQDQAIQLISKTLDGLVKQVADGFGGVHARQDTANGRTGKIEADILLMKQETRYNKVIWYLFTTAVSACGILLTFILLHG
jgi:hypothetical protein